MNRGLDTAAEEAITEVFSDISVSQSKTYERLTDLINFIQEKQETLEVE